MTQTLSPRPFRLNGWHVLAMFVAFFGAVLAVDTVMMVKAYGTYPGEASDTPFEEGLAFDTELAQQRAQTALGWRMTVGFGAPGYVDLNASDAQGRPLRSMRIQARLERPATETGRRGLSFHETAPGVYETRTGALTGAWDIRLSAFDRQGRRFDAERRLIAP